MASLPKKLRPKAHHGELSWFTHWYDDAGKRRDKWFGKTADVTERQANGAFNIWLAQWRSQDRIKNPKSTQYTYSVSDLAADYLAYARATFVKHGRVTSHVWEIAYAMQILVDTFPTRPASNIEAPDLAALRDAMIFGRAGKADAARSVKTVNNRLGIIKQAYAWAREKGYVTKEALADISIVKPLVEGRCAAAPSVQIAPVDEHWVVLTKSQCPAPVAALIQIQWLTGMRPGEAVIMRASDIDMSGEVWLYYPSEHKLEHMDKQRIIPLGPKAQEIIKPFLSRSIEAYLFSPAEAQAERNQKRRQARKVQPFSSWYRKPVQNATARLGDFYREESYRKAIHHACRKAHPFPGHKTAKAIRAMTPTDRIKYASELKEWHKTHRWNPNQLRHAAATRMNKMFSLEDVSVNLGHSDLRTTRIYALPDVNRAVAIAKKVG